MLKTKFLVTVSNKDDYVNYDMLTIKELRHFLKSGIIISGVGGICPIILPFYAYSGYVYPIFTLYSGSIFHYANRRYSRCEVYHGK